MQWNMFKVKEQKHRNRCEGRKSNSQGKSRSCAHKVHTPIGDGRMVGQTYGRTGGRTCGHTERKLCGIIIYCSVDFTGSRLNPAIYSNE